MPKRRMSGWQKVQRGVAPAVVWGEDGSYVKSRPTKDPAKAEIERLERLEKFKDLVALYEGKTNR